MSQVAEGDYDGLVTVMGFLMKVKERQTTTDEMFGPLHETISLLKTYEMELPQEANVLLNVGIIFSSQYFLNKIYTT